MPEVPNVQMNEITKKIELFVRDFFKIQLVINPLRKKITFSFDEVQCFYFLKEFRTNIIRFFFIPFIWTFRTSGTDIKQNFLEISEELVRYFFYN